MRLLLEYHWPGNVRELKNVINKAVLITNDKIIQANQLSIKLLKDLPVNMKLPNDTEILSLKTMMKQYEFEIIQRAIEMHNGNKSKVAKLLDINIRSLHRKISQQNTS